MIVLVMGVAGVGKTTIGEGLARRLGWRFIDADDYHPPQNVAKMKAGIPLDDADRWPWLGHLNRIIRAELDAVIACSALKQSYRERLAQGIHDFCIVYLHGRPELIRSRMATRTHRYMPATLLDSQFAALEPPSDAISIDIVATPDECLANIVARLAAGTIARSGD
ncbi:MAG TPA: gluconokinase [Burkholderiales bacterium]|nr:gluconokinase [Burkholderiales bacterium]